jgi:hypothetical protein
MSGVAQRSRPQSDETRTTCQGLTFDQLGRVAVVGDELRVTGVRLRVIEVDGPRIRRLEARFPDVRSGGAPKVEPDLPAGPQRRRVRFASGVTS